MFVCNCGDGADNFGQPGCVGNLNRAQKLGFIPRVANDGVINSIKSTDTLDASYFSDLINEPDKSKRLQPSPVINKVNDSRAEFNTFEIDGFKITTSEGVRTIMFTVIDGAHPKMAKAFNSRACEDTAFYNFSISDQVGGNGSVAGELRPFRIKTHTMRAVFNPENKEKETPAMVMVSFDMHELEKDSDIAYINYGTGATDVQIIVTDLTGLIDVTMAPAASITTTTFVVDISLSSYGTAFKKLPFVGGVVADFTLKEVTPTPGTITITSVTESSTIPGRYTFVQPTATAADLQRLTFAKDGYEAAGTIDITIP